MKAVRRGSMRQCSVRKIACRFLRNVLVRPLSTAVVFHSVSPRRGLVVSWTHSMPSGFSRQILMFHSRKSKPNIGAVFCAILAFQGNRCRGTTKK